ncbi:hypothetical protein D3C76_1056510 [compost metagenome]
MHAAVPAFQGDPDVRVGFGARRDRQRGAHVVRCTEENGAGGAQASWLADAQVGCLDVFYAGLAQRCIERFEVAGGAVGVWRLVTQFRKVEAVRADLDVTDHVGAKAGVAAEQPGVGEVLGHEAQRDQDQQDVQVKTPLQPKLLQRAGGQGLGLAHEWISTVVSL